MTANRQSTKNHSKHLLFQFLNQNIPIKPGHRLPKELTGYLRIEIDRSEGKEINLLLINDTHTRRLNRAKIPSKIVINKAGFMELSFYFTEIGFGAVKPLDTYQFTFKLCLHLSMKGKSAGFLFISEPGEQDKFSEELYLGRMILSPKLNSQDGSAENSPISASGGSSVSSSKSPSTSPSVAAKVNKNKSCRLVG